MPVDATQTIIAQAPAAALMLDPVSGPPLGPIEIPSGKQAVLGRSSQSTIVLPDESVSRKHACIRPAAGTWFIEDLGSRHGTFVNAVPIVSGQTAPLKRGDLVAIGPWSFRVRIGAPGGGGLSTTTGNHVTTTVAGPAKAERVERVADRELAQLTRNRLNLLIDVAGALAGAPDERTLARIISEAAIRGTGFPRVAVLSETGSSMEVRVICESDPQGSRIDPPVTPGNQPTAADAPIAPSTSYSRSLIAEARKGEVARLTSDQAMSTTESIMRLGIQTALCAPIVMSGANAANTVIGFLYLDARQGENAPGGLSAQAEKRPSAVATVQNDAAAFCQALAKMYALALANISRADLERRQRELEGDLKAAHEAQQAIMPPEEGKHGPVQYAMRCKSGRYVAGDLFGVVELPGGKIAVFLGDVAGKGVGAAIYMATAQTHLTVALAANPDPAAAVNAVNRRLCGLDMGSRFISLWLGIIDPQERSATYVDAGHGYCLHVKNPVNQSDAIATPRRLPGLGGIPLGIDRDHVYSADMIPLAPGERLVVFSDGVVEQPAAAGVDPDGGDANASAEQFGMERAAAAIALSKSPPGDVAALFDAVFKHAGMDALADDTTVASVTFTDF